jgi:hypothetical protein
MPQLYPGVSGRFTVANYRMHPPRSKSIRCSLRQGVLRSRHRKYAGRFSFGRIIHSGDLRTHWFSLRCLRMTRSPSGFDAVKIVQAGTDTRVCGESCSPVEPSPSHRSCQKALRKEYRPQEAAGHTCRPVAWELEPALWIDRRKVAVSALHSVHGFETALPRPGV